MRLAVRQQSFPTPPCDRVNSARQANTGGCSNITVARASCSLSAVFPLDMRPPPFICFICWKDAIQLRKCKAVVWAPAHPFSRRRLEESSICHCHGFSLLPQPLIQIAQRAPAKRLLAGQRLSSFALLRRAALLAARPQGKEPETARNSRSSAGNCRVLVRSVGQLVRDQMPAGDVVDQGAQRPWRPEAG